MSMKKGILILAISVAANANAQSLKDALYGGRLKSDSGSVIKKGDDLSTKIDTGRQKPVDTTKNKMLVSGAGMKNSTVQPAKAATSDALNGDHKSTLKDNSKIWKEFIDSAISTFKEEVLPSKKIKKGDYIITVDYEIDTAGIITIKNVYPSPDSKYLEEQVKERLTISAPIMNPVQASNGKPRKVSKRFNFNLSKN